MNRIMAVVVVLLAALSSARANGTAYYFDINGTNAGFGSPSGSYNMSGSFWSTSNAGTGSTAGWPQYQQITFGYTGTAGIDGSTFTINLNGGWIGGISVNSGSANVTLSGSDNAPLSSPQTWTVASGSTLTESSTWNGTGLNFSGASVTLAGGGAINFTTVVGYNNGSVTQNGTLTVNLSGAGAATQGSYALVNGYLNFANASAFQGMTSSQKFTINGGTIDNTTGTSATLNVGTGTYSIGGSFTFTGTKDLSFGTAAVALTASSTITANANTLTIGGTISGSGYGITKAGSGTLALTGANSYSGGTTIIDGTLTIGGSGVLGGGAYAGGITNNGVLNYSSSVSQTLSGAISGSGALFKNGDGALTLSGTNMYTGDTTVINGNLTVSGSNVLPTNTTLRITSPGVVDLSGSNTVEKLYINGKEAYAGTWGSASSGAKYSDGHFSGTGILRVAKSDNNPGMVITIQ